MLSTDKSTGSSKYLGKFSLLNLFNACQNA